MQRYLTFLCISYRESVKLLLGLLDALGEELRLLLVRLYQGVC